MLLLTYLLTLLSFATFSSECRQSVTDCPSDASLCAEISSDHGTDALRLIKRIIKQRYLFVVVVSNKIDGGLIKVLTIIGFFAFNFMRQMHWR